MFPEKTFLLHLVAACLLWLDFCGATTVVSENEGSDRSSSED